MEKKAEMLYKLCEALTEEMADYVRKIEKSDGMSAGDLEAIDKLSHALKSVKTTLAMIEAENGYSNNYMSYANNGSGSGGGQSNRGGSSYARNGRRDSRGRYSREGGYSYAEDEMQSIIEDIRGVMVDLPDEKRRKVERLVAELER